MKETLICNGCGREISDSDALTVVYEDTEEDFRYYCVSCWPINYGEVIPTTIGED